MARWGARILAAVDRASKAASLLSGLAVLVITLMITYDVLLRYFFARPQLYVDELASFLLVLVIFWGVAYTFQGGGHIRVDLLTSRLGPRGRAGLRAATLAIGIAFLAIVVWETLSTALRAYRLERVSTVMLYPLWAPMLLIPLGLSLMGLAMAAALVRQVRAAARGEWEWKEVSRTGSPE